MIQKIKNTFVYLDIIFLLIYISFQMDQVANHVSLALFDCLSL